MTELKLQDLGENTGVDLHDLEAGHGFLDTVSTAHKPDFKIKPSTLQKKPLRMCKDKPKNGRKNICESYIQ